MRPARTLSTAAAGLLAATLGAGAAPAPGIAVDYSVMLAGFSIGTAQLSGTFEGPRYRLDVKANLTGLVGAITGGHGAAQASGSLTGPRPVPAAFAVASHTASNSIVIRMGLARGDVVAAEITPPLQEFPDRVPVTTALKRGIIDPASALVMPVVGRAGPTDPANCDRTIPVFDGVTRFNVVLSYGETRTVEKPGYSGPVLVCNARYRPLAGHRADRPGVKFMEENREMSVWLAPVADARVLVPLRISVLTQLGTNIIEATRITRSGTAAEAPGAAARTEVASAPAP